MADLTEVYDALRKAHAAGDTENAQKLADYIAGQSRGGKSYDSIGNGQIVPTGSDAAKAAQSPVSGSGFQTALEGTGKFLSDMYTGSQQFGSKLLSPLGSGFAAVNQQANQDAQNSRQNDAPLMATGAGKIGYVTGSLPASVLPGANTALGSAAIGASMGAMSPTVGDESRLTNTGVGGALGLGGQVIGNKLASLLNPRAAAGSGLTAAQQAALTGGESVGMRATPGVKSGSVALQQFESKLDSQPWSSGPFNAIKAGNQRALGSAVAQSIGEQGHSVDATVLGSANQRLGDVFNSVRDPRKMVVVDPATTKSAIDAIDHEASGLLPNNSSIRDNPLVAQLENLTSSGSINAQQLGSLSSKLGKAAYKQMSGVTGDRDLGQALYSVKDHVDDLVQASLSPAESAEYAAARGQYRNLMMLTSRTNIVNPSSGEVSGANLASKLQQSDKSGFLYGKNQTPMYQAARFAQAFKPIVGNSGTATRSPNITSLTELPLGLASNLASRAYLSGPGSAAVRGLMKSGSAAANIGGLLGNRFPQLQGLLRSPLNAGAVAPLLPYLTQK